MRVCPVFWKMNTNARTTTTPQAIIRGEGLKRRSAGLPLGSVITPPSWGSMAEIQKHRVGPEMVDARTAGRPRSRVAFPCGGERRLR
jgi:hypothetical protein